MNVQRKTILTSTFLLLLSIIIIISVQTYCQSNNAILYGNDVEIPINHEGIFYINVSGIDDLAFLTIDISWDPDVITVSEINDSNSDFDMVFSDIDDSQGTIDIDAYIFDESLSGDNIVVCSLICEPSQNANIGDSCDVLFENSILWNSTGNEVQHISQSANINITEDVSGNVIIFIDDDELELNDEGLSLINISGVEELAFVTLEVVWDPEVINVAEVNDAVSDFDLVFSNVNENAGHLSLNAYRFDNIGLSGNVVVCGLAIEPSTQAMVGDSCVIELNQSILWNVSVDKLDHGTNNGTITIVEPEDGEAQETTIHANEISMEIDATGLIHINITDAAAIAYLSLNMSWDTSVVQLDEVDDTVSDFNMIFPLINSDVGYVKIDAYDYSAQGITGDAIICGLSFSADDNAIVGDISSIIFTDIDVYNTTMDKLPSYSDNGAITLIEDSGNDGGGDTGGSTGGSSGGSSGGGFPPPEENNDPIAVISVSTTIEFIDTSISFDASESSDDDGHELSYMWDFGDGSESTEKITSHSYNTPDVYAVTLTVDDGHGGTDSTTIDISINPPGNNPPEQLQVTKDTTAAHQNTVVSYTAVAVDLDGNDTIRYIFDWGDGSNKTISDYLNSSVLFETSHSWSMYGKYTVKILAEDNNNARSETVTITMYIDIKEIDDDITGWLIDTDGDGIYDSFKDTDTNEICSIKKINDSYYCIDNNNDQSWDYEFNIESNELTAYAGDTSEAGDDSGILFLLGFVILIFIVLVVLLNRKKPSSKDKDDSEKDAKKRK
jgi:PKD repeat protein